MKARKYVLITVCMIALKLFGQKPIVLNSEYEHDKWKTVPRDVIREFAAFTVSFDGADDNNGDGDADLWGIPEWVAYEIKRVQNEHNLEGRPKWFTDDELINCGIAPNDNTYAVKGTRELSIVKDNYRFVRGHMCPKDAAERISEDAAYNTHTVLNAVPQLQWQNNGVWKELENKCTDWADEYGSVWVVCGPVFFNMEPAMWLGQDGEKMAAIPDALFKIIIRENGGNTEVLAFVIPNIIKETDMVLENFLTTVDYVEEITELNFLTALPDDIQKELEKTKREKFSQ